jgi:hypothetical protein
MRPKNRPSGNNANNSTVHNMSTLRPPPPQLQAPSSFTAFQFRPQQPSEAPDIHTESDNHRMQRITVVKIMEKKNQEKSKYYNANALFVATFPPSERHREFPFRRTSSSGSHHIFLKVFFTKVRQQEMPNVVCIERHQMVLRTKNKIVDGSGRLLSPGHWSASV